MSDHPPRPPERTEKLLIDGTVADGYNVDDVLAWIRETHAFHMSRLVGLSTDTPDAAVGHAFEAQRMIEVLEELFEGALCEAGEVSTRLSWYEHPSQN